ELHLEIYLCDRHEGTLARCQRTKLLMTFFVQAIKGKYIYVRYFIFECHVQHRARCNFEEVNITHRSFNGPKKTNAIPS
ncbi:unnamed protein product, partial [Heterotrigona itama]